ncbi:hypothetical protein CTA2_71 [Colletotrichum tanaceti]|uniref:CCHC-type domain-containing protein n=1 Tax=Colletotrichum tanaceti TaxID=1306861 RepID=A0A4U6XL34_9PEZI|nr:hypothetical protein CTA2_58 [Colletotrichum tanaceti]KAJ0169047.1 hypothetical protein CTA2_71 [Colletotrichum tanaceti]TKW56348.1 hypothetical protein CTA1_1804 [Colletotrichum tanaceti]
MRTSISPHPGGASGPSTATTHTEPVLSTADMTEADFLGMSLTEFYRLRQREVEGELERHFPDTKDDVKLLGIYTRWLVFQIPNLGHRSHKDSSITIRRGCDYLRSRNYTKGVVIAAFSSHRNHFLREFPEGCRAFNFARRDIEINYKGPSGVRSEPGPPLSSTNKASCSSALPQIQLPLRVLVTPKVKETHRDSVNQSPTNRQMLLARLEELKTKTPSSTSTLNKAPVLSSPETRIPPANYVCNRCGIPGHFVKDCDTIRNLSHNNQPPKGYICRTCGAARAHFAQDCPQNVAKRFDGLTTGKDRSTSISNVNPRRDTEEGRVISRHISVDSSNNGIKGPKISPKVERVRKTDDVSHAGRHRMPSFNQASSTVGEYMSEERARYIQSHTDDSSFEPQSSPTPTGGPLKSGSNLSPIGRRRRPDLYRPADSYRADSSYRPVDSYRPDEGRRPETSDHYDESRRNEHPDCRDERRSTYGAEVSRRYEPSDRRDSSSRRETPAYLSASRHAGGSAQPNRPARRGPTDPREVGENKTARKKETTTCSLPKRKRSDGRLSPWDNIQPPPKKPRQQDPWASGLPWDDIDMSPKRHQRDSAGTSTAKQVSNVDNKPAPSSITNEAALSENEAMVPDEVADAERRARTEADAFLEAFATELAERLELDALANSKNDGGSASALSHLASSASCGDFDRPLEDSAPSGNEDATMVDALGEGAESARSMSCEEDEDSSDEDSSEPLKPLQREPPYDPSVLSLFQDKDAGACINTTKRRTAVEMYEEAGEDRTTTNKMSYL